MERLFCTKHENPLEARDKKQEIRRKEKRCGILEARYESLDTRSKIQEPLAFGRPIFFRKATQLMLNIEC